MNKILMLFLSISSLSLAETYKVNVKRVGQDLYKTLDNVIIKTRYCYEYSYGEDAILVYEDYSYDNKLIFIDADTSCEVDKILN
ncbi:MAG: hypothetical protein ACTSXL_00770 [Alphaproteobacteria bacterium]